MRRPWLARGLARADGGPAWCAGGMARKPPGRPDEPRPGLAAVLWCVAVIVGILVLGVAARLFDAGR